MRKLIHQVEIPGVEFQYQHNIKNIIYLFVYALTCFHSQTLLESLGKRVAGVMSETLRKNLQMLEEGLS